jgi:hypothetical protein
MLCGLVLEGDSAQAADLDAFKALSGNIVCELDNGAVDCFIKSGLNPAPRRTDVCHIGDPPSIRSNSSPSTLPRPCSVPVILGR